jgi:hypothetical protein
MVARRREDGLPISASLYHLCPPLLSLLPLPHQSAAVGVGHHLLAILQV